MREWYHTGISTKHFENLERDKKTKDVSVKKKNKSDGIKAKVVPVCMIGLSHLNIQRMWFIFKIGSNSIYS